MAIDREKYIKKYIDEGLENTALIESLVFDIKDGISSEDDFATLLRALHTLKGTSRMLEFKRIEELSHALESVFAALREKKIRLSENAIKLILFSIDTLKSGFNILHETKNDDIEINEYVENLSLLASNEEFSISNINSLSTAKKDTKSETIRISLGKIDSIIKSISSLQTLEISAKSLSKDSAELMKIIREFSDTPAAPNLRKLERLGKRLNSMAKNLAIDTGNHIRSAYDNVISLRTLPISTILDNYPRYVYQLSDELGKKISLKIEGKENEIDKNIIESLSDVFMHMVRNAVDHGLETPQDRVKAGKNEVGNLSISCSRESGSMKIILSDDGRGIDLDKIRQKAIRDGFVGETAAAELSKEDLTNYIFQSGFSTSKSVSNVSGRGVGMDVVRETIESMKGSIVVESFQGKGTTFTIMVPLSIEALMGFPIECAGMKFIIPANFVDNIMLLNRDEILTVIDRPEIKYNDRIIKLNYLSQILQIKNESVKTSETIFVIIIHSYDDIAAVAVDNIDSMRSVILKTMPMFLETMNIFSGIVLNENYEMASVLHIPTIMKMSKNSKLMDVK